MVLFTLKYYENIIFYRKSENLSELAVKQGFIIWDTSASVVWGLRPGLGTRSGHGRQGELCLRPDSNKKLFKSLRSDQVPIVAWYFGHKNI